MPQTFQVLRCYKCAVFQIHPRKKSIKFQCKMCNEKQSIRRHYGIGTGKDCRLHVQRLNGLRGDNSLHDTSNDDEDEDENPCAYDTKPINSKWSEYIEETIKTCDKPMYLDNTEVVLEVPSKRARKSEKGAVYKNNFNKRYVDTNNIDDNEDNIDTNSANVTDFINNKINSVSNQRTNKPYVKFVAPIAKLKTENDTQACFKVKENYEIVKNKPSKLEEEKKIVEKPKSSANSKWAQFVDTENEDTDHIQQTFDGTEDASANDPKALFSLCNDADLDNVLDI